MAVERDYYKLLGVPRGASREEIKQAYRELIRRHHPDTHQGDPSAEEKMKRINEAYECLSDRESRRIYDALGHGGLAAKMAGKPARGEDVSLSLSVTFEEVCGGARKTVRFSRTERCPDCAGDVSVCGRCLGTGYVRADKRFNINVPAGIAGGQVMQIKGEGCAGRHGGENGDLLIKISAEESDIFTRSGSDLYADVPVTLSTAALGGDINIPTLEGSEKYTVSAGARSGELYRLEGRGLPDMNGGRGDLFIKLHTETPVNLSVSQREALRRADGLMQSCNYPSVRDFERKIKNFYKDK